MEERRNYLRRNGHDLTQIERKEEMSQDILTLLIGTGTNKNDNDNGKI